MLLTSLPAVGGLTNAQIALELDISPHTARRHAERLLLSWACAGARTSARRSSSEPHPLAFSPSPNQRARSDSMPRK